MGRDSTESGEDSDLLIGAEPKVVGISSTADKNNEDCVKGKGDISKRYMCLFQGCSLSFRQLSRFSAHQFSHTDVRPYPCDQEGCDKAYTNFPHVKRHVLTDHKKKLVYEDYMNTLYENEQIVFDKSEKIHKCTYPDCTATFVRPNKLKAHERTHTNERCYVCTVEGCRKSYTNHSHLKRHILSVHNPKPVGVTYKCIFEGCKLTFQTKQGMKKHYKRQHEDLEYKCAECNVAFKKHKQLKLHQFQHYGAPKLSCQKCNKIFDTENQLDRHKERGHKIYNCTVKKCTEGPFPLWTLYRKHMVLKHRPDFICDICQMSFPFKFRLRMHKEQKHSSSEVKPWPCPHPDCNHTFKDKRNMSQHIRHVHEGECFLCPQEGCGKTFYWKASLDRHVRLHTSNRPIPRPRKKPKKRKDFGKPKKSMASILTGINLPLEIEKKLVENETINSEEDNLIAKFGIIASSTSCEESEEGSRIKTSVSKPESVNKRSDSLCKSVNVETAVGSNAST